MSRQQRQRQDVLAAFRAGDGMRAAVLVREHLSEFPDDDAVFGAVAACIADPGCAGPASDELRRILEQLLGSECEGFVD